ncbi:NAD(P)/FAD-dependent oxidoreductase [Arthrobacter mobilis]|uniref:FAD-binding oxidoreductase n=1 Tax=Arthrobacter mobilis TaxID=2724944 RepID=A0A7X6K7N3_9MICC|nr:FAD-dependent oxidoreductase [Arthrobacter mobilis]NKX56664.1 FAD-binding oxidoreductase [Arthrobacter mobilis]
MLLDQADIVVVGGGIVGVSTAYALNQRGFDVVLVEQRFMAFGASGRNSGGLWFQTARGGAELELLRRSTELYAGLEADLGRTYDFDRCGGVFFFETEQQREILTDYAEDRRRLGISAEFISVDQAREIAPGVPETALGAVYSADDAKVNTSKFVRALNQLSSRLGVRVYENTPVLSLVRNGDSITGVRTVRGNIMGGGVVWCAGPWAANLEAEGISLPLELLRVGLLTTQPIRSRLKAIARGPFGAQRNSVLETLPAFDPAVFDADKGLSGRLGYDDSVIQGADGNLLIGHTLDAAGSLNPHITLNASRMMIDTILQRHPEYGDLGVTGLWAGIVGCTPDRLPIIDNVEGLFVNTGHSNGAGTGPFSGQLMAQLVAGEEPAMPLENFSSDRPGLSAGRSNDRTPPYGLSRI